MTERKKPWWRVSWGFIERLTDLFDEGWRGVVYTKRGQDGMMREWCHDPNDPTGPLIPYEGSDMQRRHDEMERELRELK